MLSLHSVLSVSLFTVLTLFFRGLQRPEDFIIALRDHTQVLNIYVDSWTFSYLA